MSTQPKSLGDKLLGIRREVLFLILIIGVTIPLFMDVRLPNQPKPESQAFFDLVSNLQEGDTILIQTDWTESTRGENGGLMKALLRMVMRQKAKFAIYSVSDVQAPEVARNIMAELNIERQKANQPVYNKWTDWVELGYFPNAEALGQSMKANIRNAFGSKRDANATGESRPVFESPVLSNINKVGDFKLFAVVTGTQSITIAMERVSKLVPMVGMVTGVMGPEQLNYYLSGQIKGLAIGLKGVYDLEFLMEDKPEYEGQINIDKGPKYIFALHIGIGLMILAIVAGNLGVFLTRNRRNA